MDWNRWLGPAPAVDFRFLAGADNETKSWSRCHYEFRWWYEYSGGKLTDWGAHHVDIATWAMDKTDSGPVSVQPVMIEHPVAFRDGFPETDDCYNTATKSLFRVLYEDGIELSISSEARNGILLEGTDGRIFVNRGGLSGVPAEDLARNPLPENMVAELGIGESANNDEAKSISLGHVRNFFESATARMPHNSDVFSHQRALRLATWRPSPEDSVARSAGIRCSDTGGCAYFSPSRCRLAELG